MQASQQILETISQINTLASTKACDPDILEVLYELEYHTIKLAEEHKAITNRLNKRDEYLKKRWEAMGGHGMPAVTK